MLTSGARPINQSAIAITDSITDYECAMNIDGCMDGTSFFVHGSSESLGLMSSECHAVISTSI